MSALACFVEAPVLPDKRSRPVYKLSVVGEICLELGANDVLTIRKARLLGIQCVRGSLWVTQADDTRDYVVEPGGCFRFETKRCGHIFALSPAKVRLFPSDLDSAPAARHALYDRLARLARSLVGRA